MPTMQIKTHDVHALSVGTRYWQVVVRLSESAAQAYPEYEDWVPLDPCVLTKRDAYRLAEQPWGQYDRIDHPFALQQCEVVAHSRTGTTSKLLARVPLDNANGQRQQSERGSVSNFW